MWVGGNVTDLIPPCLSTMRTRVGTQCLEVENVLLYCSFCGDVGNGTPTKTNNKKTKNFSLIVKRLLLRMCDQKTNCSEARLVFNILNTLKDQLLYGIVN